MVLLYYKYICIKIMDMDHASQVLIVNGLMFIQYFIFEKTLFDKTELYCIFRNVTFYKYVFL